MVSAERRAEEGEREKARAGMGARWAKKECPRLLLTAGEEV